MGTSPEGVFCTGTGSPQIGPYTLDFDTVPLPISGTTNLIRVTLDLGFFDQEPAPGETRRRLQTPLDPLVNGGDGAPDMIVFQGTFSPDCTFRAVSTQGGMITGNLDYWSHSHTSVNVDFTQSGQVTSPLTSLPGQFQDDNVVGLFVSNFAFAFSGTFDDHM